MAVLEFFFKEFKVDRLIGSFYIYKNQVLRQGN